MAQVTASGLFVVDIKQQQAVKTVRSEHQSGKRPTKSDLAVFTRRMSDLASAGLPLDRVLTVVAEQSENAVLSGIALDALEDVRAGSSVSQALAKHPKVFSDVYTQTLRAGEASGQFPEVTTRLADFLETEVMRRSQIVGALTYPAILTVVMVGVILFILGFVVPRMTPVFSGLGKDLPVTTSILLGVSGFLSQNWMVIVIGVIAAFILYRIWISTESGLLARDSMVLQMPLIGPVWLKSTVSRYAHVLGTLLYGGVPVLEALQISGLSAGNRLFKKSSDAVADDVREGKSIAQSMRDVGAFPSVLAHMVATGEETGDLPKMLARVARSLDFEVDIAVKKLTTYIEPVVMIVFGTIVGFVVLSIILPIYAAQDLVK